MTFALYIMGNTCAQTLQNQTNTYVIQVWPDVYISCKEVYTYYVNDEGHYVRHGKYTLTGSKPVEREYYVGSGFSCNYSFTTNYIDGKFDGAMKSNLSIKGRYKFMNWNLTENFSANFKSGILHGGLQYNLKDYTDGDHYENKATINYKNGKVDGDFNIYTKDHLHANSGGTTFKGHAVNGFCDGRVIVGQNEYLFDTGILLSKIIRDEFGKVLLSEQYTTAKITDQMRTDLRNNASDIVKASHGFKSKIKSGMQQYEWLSWDFYEEINRILARYGRLVPKVQTDWDQSTKLVDFDGVFLPPFELVEVTVFPVMNSREYNDLKIEIEWNYNPVFTTIPDFYSITNPIINADTDVVINEELVNTVFGNYLQSNYAFEKNSDVFQKQIQESLTIKNRTLSDEQYSGLKDFARKLEAKGIKDYLTAERQKVIRERKNKIVELTHQQLIKDVEWLNSEYNNFANAPNAFWAPVQTEQSSIFDSAKVENDSCFLYCTLLRQSNTLGWETWSSIYTLSSPYARVPDEKAIKNFTFLKCLPNEWDTVRSMRDTIINLEKRVYDKAEMLGREDILSSYKREDLGIDRNLLEATSYLQAYDNIIHKQKEYLHFMELVTLILSQSKQILSTENVFSDIQNNYLVFSHSMDLQLNDNAGNCIQRLNTYDNIQQNCLHFIELRKVVAQNDIRLREKMSSTKTIAKAYITFFNDSNLIWTSDLASNPDLLEIIDIQKRVFRILDNPSIKEKEKLARKVKDKSLENILEVLNNQ